MHGTDVHIVYMPAGTEQDAVARMRGNPAVRFAELDRLASPSGTSTDSSSTGNWHLSTINASAAWKSTVGEGVTIAILDSGVDGSHPDLAAKMVPGWNFVDGTSDASDSFGHGTAVAGAAAASFNDVAGTGGVAVGAKIMPVRVANAAGLAYLSNIAEGLTWASDRGTRIASIGFEGMAASGTMQTAARYFRARGGIVIVTAGNSGSADSTAATDAMMVVSATDAQDRIASWSTYGNFVDISAPGQDIRSTSVGGGYATWSGTSMAAPIVAGTAALILALRPDLTPTQVESALHESATDLGAPGRDIYYGFGRVNVEAAVQTANAMVADASGRLPTSVVLAVPSTSCKHATPSIVMTPAQSPGVLGGTMVPFEVTVVNNDDASCDVSTFNLTHAKPPGWTVTSPAPVMSLSPGTRASSTLQVTSPAGTASSSHSITATATNRDSRKTLASASSIYMVTDATSATAPGAPIMGTATAGNAQASVTFSPPSSDGGSPITTYKAYSTPGNINVSGSGSPIVVSGLTNGVAYTFIVRAFTAVGHSGPSATSNSVTPSAGATVPGAPTIVTATAGNTQATVSFSPPASNGGSAITSYRVTSSPGAVTSTGAASPIAVPGLTNGTAYTFTVQALNAVGTGTASAASNSVTPAAAATVPGAPTIGTATAGNAQATVNFSPPASDGGSAITSYRVSSSPGANTATGAASPITVPGLTNGTGYTFTVQAINTVGTGAASAASNSVTPAAAATVPGAPTIGIATAGDAQATVNFSPPASNGGSAITSYRVTSSPGAVTATGSASPITMPGLTNGTAHTFTVQAINAVGTGAASAASNSVTPAAATAPGAPITGTATAGNAQASVTFSPPSSDGGSPITTYKAYSTPGNINVSGSGSPIVVSGLTNGVAYTFIVRAFTAVGHSGPSATSNSVTPSAGATVPGAPTIVTATAGNTQATVSFSPPASNGGSAITSYRVTSSPGAVTSTGAASPIAVPGLTNGTAYTFTVQALNAVGTGAASAPSNSVTPSAGATVPGAPTIGTATAGDAQATVSFSPPASNGGSAITSYKVTSSPGAITANGAASPITIPGLANGVTYTFTVQAVNAIGTGAPSAASNPVTPAAAGGNSYSTSFPGTENPISESGKWINGKTAGVNWNNVQTVPGRAYGSVVVSGYDDDIAVLNTAFPRNQYAQATVFRVAGYSPGVSHEVELLLNFRITPNSARGYEVLWGVSGYLAIVRWNGPLNNYTPLLENVNPGIGAPVDGDVLRAEVVNGVIRAYKNGVLVGSATDSTWTDGQPGVGFWPTSGATPQNLGWKNFAAGGL
ncbi:MAG: fibronectin type III domain-containing protein [Betaproteobacteria bacterium]